METANLDNPTPDGDLDVLIQKKERELRPLRWRMEQLQIQFINQFTQFAIGWYQKTAKEYVTKYPETTLNLSRESIGNMKAKVNNLQNAANEIVKNALSNPNVWWHLEPQLHDSFSQYEQLGNDRIGNKFPEKVDKPIRQALGELGTVLEQFGFNVSTKPAMRASYPEFWFYYPQGEGKPSKPFFPHLLDWSREMQQTLEGYNGFFKKGIELFNEIQRLKEERKKQQALDLWDST